MIFKLRLRFVYVISLLLFEMFDIIENTHVVFLLLFELGASEVALEGGGGGDVLPIVSSFYC